MFGWLFGRMVMYYSRPTKSAPIRLFVKSRGSVTLIPFRIWHCQFLLTFTQLPGVVEEDSNIKIGIFSDLTNGSIPHKYSRIPCMKTRINWGPSISSYWTISLMVSIPPKVLIFPTTVSSWGSEAVNQKFYIFAAKSKLTATAAVARLYRVSRQQAFFYEAKDHFF